MLISVGNNADVDLPAVEITDHEAHNSTDREKLITYATKRQRSSVVFLRAQAATKHICEVTFAMV